MKKILFFFAILIFSLDAKSQYVTIPDTNFVIWLQANVPSAMNGNQMDTTDVAVTNRLSIDVENLGITDLTGAQYFDSLQKLDCGNGFGTTNLNVLISLPSLPTSIDTLICGLNQITNLPSLPNTLKVIECYNNNLTALPALPLSLIFLNCSDNQISSLPVLPSLLLSLNCGSNVLTNLPPLPNSLTNLSCYGNQITNLPVLPNTLIDINCFYNQLATLPSLPASLQYLYCSQNLLTSLPVLPNSLSILNCFINQLTSIPSLPNSLTQLNCSSNLLTSLPALPMALQILICDGNQLTNLPVLPNTIDYLFCNNNSITCFPVFPNALVAPTIFNISNNPFSCLPNYVPAMNAATLAYPLCVSGNINSCPNAEGVFGFVFEDKNSDCNKNVGDSILKNVPVYLYNNNSNLLGQTYSALNGVYDFPQTNNTYTVVIDTSGVPFTAQCTFPGLDSTVTVVSIDTNINFSLTCKPGFDIGVQSTVIGGWVFPGQQHGLNCMAGDMSHWYNLNCATGISGQVQITVNGPVIYAGAGPGALIPTVAGNVYTYTVADFGVINNVTDFNLLFNTNISAQAGDTICVSVIVLPNASDNNISNNTFNFCYQVVNSHDPNAKEVYPVDVTPFYNGWFTYTIHFQNTGTASAMNVRIVDTLDNNLDLSTFQILNYSHKNTSFVKGDVLSFNFPNIMLADSGSSMSGSQGYVQYRIKPQVNLPAGTQIKNTASIYFDFNSGVVTNTTTNNFISGNNIQGQINNIEIKIFPNPANETLTIESKLREATLVIIDVLGKEIRREKISNKMKLDISNLSKGVYFLRFQTESGIFTSRLIKE